MRAELVETRGELQRLEGRVTLMTAGRAPARAPAAPAARRAAPTALAAPTAPTTMPTLPVVRLNKDASVARPVQETTDSGAVDDGSPPIMITVGPGSGKRRLAVDRDVLKKPDPVNGRAARRRAEKAAAGGTMQEQYTSALSALRDANKPAKAERLFGAFIKNHPNTRLTDNAAYWRAECSHAQGQHQVAINRFLEVVERFPRSSKVPDAMLRVAQSWGELGHAARATEVFRRIADKYPDSEAARAAHAALGSKDGVN